MGSAELTKVVRIVADSPQQLATARLRLQKLFAGERALFPDGKVLWHECLASIDCAVGLEEIGARTCSFILRDARCKLLRLYGAQGARVQAHDALVRYIETWEQQRVLVPVPPLAWKPLLRGLSALTAATGAVVSLDILNRGLTVQGDEQSLARVQQYLSALASRCAPRTPLAAPSVQTELCPVCLCVAGEDEDEGGAEAAWLKLDCSHVYCRACFAMWLAQMTDGDSSCGGKFPIKCCAASCSLPVSLSDLALCAAPQVLALVKRAALDDFVNSNLDTVRPCPLPNCTNILTVGVGGDEGRVVYCAGCRASFCAVCEVEEHEGLTCAQYRVADAPPNELRNKVIEDILTTKCPRCKKAFQDFEGCFALTCSNCPCAFCAWCLADCGSNAHNHVASCSAKTNNDTYFGTKQEYLAVTQKRMARDLQTFLDGLGSTGAQRAALLETLAADLADLHIVVR
ncbi:hypothetical protein B484DRAFT_348798 [Ochromonadaceae sp. CCMP2298]|nr:hypothetical protein B484DRAFT_348798 [Ochromonadaceae sp. CCMP2298]